MFLPKQRRLLFVAASSLTVNLMSFDFTDTDKEIRVTHKQSSFYFRVVELDMKIVRMSGYALYVYYTPTKYGVAVDPIKEMSHSADTWDDVKKSFTDWLNWIREEFNEDIGQQVSEQDDDVFAHWDELIASPSLTHLHPTVQNAAGSLFATNHYPQAIHSACTALEKAIQVKAGQSASITGTTLLGKAFPKDKPLISLSDDQGEREGYSFLYRGLLQAIRNHYAHNFTEIPAARALEWLGFISALFYKLDEA